MLDSCADRIAEALDKFQVPQIAAGFFWTAGHKGERQFFVDVRPRPVPYKPQQRFVCGSLRHFLREKVQNESHPRIHVDICIDIYISIYISFFLSYLSFYIDIIH